MRIIIIEDEQNTAKDLAKTITKIDSKIEVIEILKSVDESIKWFSKNLMPDLIFSDIQLGDGLSFDIFEKIKCTIPIIFCTAFNEYAIKAFKSNGIDYILKPYEQKSISSALEKYKNLENNFAKNYVQYEKVFEFLKTKSNANKGALLVNTKNNILPIKYVEIALFYIENEITHLITFKNSLHFTDKTMEEISKMAGNAFFRINRQFCVNRKAILNVSPCLESRFSLKLNIDFDKEIIVARTKNQEFLDWLTDK